MKVFPKVAIFIGLPPSVFVEVIEVHRLAQIIVAAIHLLPIIYIMFFPYITSNSLLEVLPLMPRLAHLAPLLLPAPPLL